MNIQQKLLFSDACVSMLHSSHSDHAPLLLQFLCPKVTKHISGVRPFRFEP